MMDSVGNRQHQAVLMLVASAWRVPNRTANAANLQRDDQGNIADDFFPESRRRMGLPLRIVPADDATACAQGDWEFIRLESRLRARLPHRLALAVTRGDEIGDTR